MLGRAKKSVLAALVIALIFLASLPHAAPICKLATETCADDSECCSGLYCDAAYHCAQDTCPAGHRGYFCSAGSCCPGLDCNTVCMDACRLKDAGCEYSSQCCSGICDPQAKICKAQPDASAISYQDIYLWVGLSVAIAATFLGLAYMAGKLFSLQILDAWVKIELQELMASLLIAVFCVALIASLNSAAQFLTKEGNAIDAAGAFLRTVHADGQQVYLQVARMYYNAARISSYSYTVGTSIGFSSTSMSESPAAGLSPLVGELGQGLDATANFMLLAAAQYSFLQFFRTAAAVMLPLGIFLRSFSLTRKVGGVVLAAVIASAVVYPASFLVSQEAYSVFAPSVRNHAANAAVKVEAGNPPASTVVCNPYVQQFLASPLPFLGGEIGWWLTICPVPCIAALAGWGACMKSCYDIVSYVYMVVKAVYPIIMAPFLLNYISNNATPSVLIDNYYTPAVQHALPAVSQYGVLSLVVFLTPLIITMVFLRNLAVTFGGEPQLYGLSKLI